MRRFLTCLLPLLFVLSGCASQLPAAWLRTEPRPSGLLPAQVISPLLLEPSTTIQPTTTDGPPAPILLAACTVHGEFVRCHDSLLALDFNYPAFFGTLAATQLRPGGIEGIAYDYIFADSGKGVAAGGRSRVFSEGRGGMFTDQMGFGDRSSAGMCAERENRGCEVVQPGVIVVLSMPEAQFICPMGYPPYVVADAEVIVNLPHHLAVNGFGFKTALLTSEQEQNFLDPIYTSGVGWTCDAETQDIYDRSMQLLTQNLQAGTAPPDIQARYDAVLQLARSIQSPYVAEDRYAPLRPLVGWNCSVTFPNGSTPPGELPSPYHHGSGSLWTRLWPSGIVLITEDRQVRADGAYLLQFPWWRGESGVLQIEGIGSSPGFEAALAEGYGDIGFQPSTLIFPSAGCWKITGRLGSSELSFFFEIKDVRSHALTPQN